MSEAGMIWKSPTWLGASPYEEAVLAVEGAVSPDRSESSSRGPGFGRNPEPGRVSWVRQPEC